MVPPILCGRSAIFGKEVPAASIRPAGGAGRRARATSGDALYRCEQARISSLALLIGVGGRVEVYPIGVTDCGSGWRGFQSLYPPQLPILEVGWRPVSHRG